MKDIFIIGDGGIGSNISVALIKFLAFYSKKPSTLHIVDGDKVSSGNLLRQQFIPEDISKFKTEITSAYLYDICNQIGCTNIKIISHPVFLKEDNIGMISDGAVVFVGVDNYVTRKVIENHAITLKNILVIFGGNEYDDGDVNLLWIKNGKMKTPLLSDKHPEINKRDKFPDEQSCEEAAVSSPQLIITNMMVANFMLSAFYDWLKNKTLEWHEIMFDLNGCNVRRIS